MPEILFQETLTDTQSNVEVGDIQWTGGAIGADERWRIAQTVLHGGKQEGSRLLTIENGAMKITLIPTRGMGIHAIEAGDLRLGWKSPIHEIVHPNFINLESRKGLGWLEGFNEWLCRCGLEWSGHPGEDTFTTNTGEQATLPLTLHGKIANIPCSNVQLRIEKGEEGEQIVIESRTDERVFHGPKLSLKSRITIGLLDTRLRLHDTIENHSSQEQEFQILYHCNFGSPLLEEGARFTGAAAHIEPFNARAAEGLASYDVFAKPTSGFVEQVYCMNLRGDADGRTSVLLSNRTEDRGASMTFSTKDLPCFTLWKNTAAAEDGYVTGLEPGTSFPRNRRIEREAGRVPRLAPGASRDFIVDVALHQTQSEISQVREAIKLL